MVTTGAQEALNIAFETLLNKYDTILVESPTYVGVFSALSVRGTKFVGIETDSEGMIPSSLLSILENWHKDILLPRVLYTVPTGQNPSGTTLPTERKQQIYEIASKYDLIILEDDPYYNLSFTDAPLRSFFSLDVDGRVLRFDSFSKILAGGLRLGWVTGPEALVEKMQQHTQAWSIHASGISQLIALNTLKLMGDAGLETHIKNIKFFYKTRRDAFLEYAEKHLKGLAEWNTPVAGMFVWLKLVGVEDSFSLIMEKAVSKKVLCLPGVHFMPEEGPCPYVRASFSTASPEQMDEGLKRLAELIRAAQTKT